MNNKLSKAIVMLVAAMLLISVVPAFAGPNMTRPANAIWIEDDNKDGNNIYDQINLTTANPSHTIGFKFNVTVWVNWTTLQPGATGLKAWQVILEYNSAYLNATKVGVTAGTTSELFTGRGTFVTSSLTPGRVGISELILTGDPVAPPVVASLCRVEFEVKAVPAKLETLTSVLNITQPEGAAARTYLKDDVGNNYYGSDCGYNAYYEFKWEPPPPAYMSIEHDGSSVWPLVYGPWPPSAVGQTFNAQIYVNVAEAWGLTSASFCLCYNSTVIGTSESDITLDAAWTGTVTLVTDRIEFAVTPTGSVSGKVLVATVKFTILLQSECPPYPKEWVDWSPLDFCDVSMMDHIGSIDVGGPRNGRVEVKALRTIPLPWLEVFPASITYGPEYSVGKEFEVKVIVKNLAAASRLIGYQVRLSYDPTLLEVVSITEGPFLKDSRWNLHGTYFISGLKTDGTFGPHLYFADLLMPPWDMTQWPQAPGPDVEPLMPYVNPVLATIRFKIIYQGLAEDESCGLDILPIFVDKPAHFMNADGEYIDEATDRIVNGTYTILHTWAVGRVIDVYGGADNMGYGSAPFPAPYGGQGLNQPMDLVVAQSKVCLFAEVTYNNWPVQSKVVSFEINGPAFTNPVKLSAITNSDGIASVCFRMPWPCENPESTFGTYTVTATVNIADEVVKDTLTFEYNYLVTIKGVTTDKTEYAHGDNVQVTIEYDYNALQSYPVLFYVVIQDELGVPIGQAVIPASGGTGTVSITIPKWAFAGTATVTVNAFDVDPTEGGAAWCPPATTTITIAPA